MKRLSLIVLFACTLAFAQDPKPAETQQPITKELLEKRMTELKQQYEQAMANANALSGALQDCKYWLEQLQKPVVPVDQPVKPQAK